MAASRPIKKLDRVLEAFYGAPWAVTEEKLDQIDDALSAIASGRPRSPEELRVMFGDPEEDDPSAIYRTQILDNGIAVMSLAGTIGQKANLFMQFSGGTSTEMFGAAFSRLVSDGAVKAIVLDTDSPGGSVFGVAELADRIFAARGAKPIVAVSNCLMASAAYWIASAAEQVVASTSSMTGSVGVYTVHRDLSVAREKWGETRTVIKAGRFKAMDEKKLDDESLQRIQERIDGIYELFTAAVARNRNTTVANVKRGYGEGTIELAADAARAGLVDRVATLEQVIEELSAKLRPASSSGSLSTPGGRAQARENMDARIKAALIAKGIIKADATDERAQSVYEGLCLGRGVAPPEDVDAAVTLVVGPAAATEGGSGTKPAAGAETPKTVKEVLGEERKRVADIKASGKLLHIPDEKIEELLALDIDAKEATHRMTQIMAEQQKSADRPDFSGHISGGREGCEAYAADAGEALEFMAQSRAGQKVDLAKVSKGAQIIARMPPSRIAEESLASMGVPVRGMSREAVCRLALKADRPDAIMAASGGAPYYTTGSFPNLALNALRKTLARGYEEAPVTYPRWVRQGEKFFDLKLQNVIKMSGASDAEETPEGDDYPIETGLTDDREFFIGAAMAKIVRLTWQALVNDDLGALSKMAPRQGVAMRRTWNKGAYRVLTGNPKMADNISLFHASSHGANLMSSGAAPSSAQLQLMQNVMALQTGLNADENALNIPLRTLLIPTALFTVAHKLSESDADPADSNAGSKNVWKGMFEVVADGQLDLANPKKYYGVGDNQVVDTMEIRFLDGHETPVTESDYDFDSGARKFLILQCGALFPIDYRGFVCNPGE